MICFVDYKISIEEEKSLQKLNFKIIKIPKCNEVYNAINGHVDIQICIIDNKKPLIIINKNISNNFKYILSENKINFIETKESITSPYPKNISINALITNDYFIHKLDSTDKNLISNIQNTKKLINVKQGYTKCSCLYLKDNALITNDPGIAKTLSSYNFDVLHLPYGDIILEDFEYGFIGGVGGMISDSHLALFGSLDKYKYGVEVKEFLKKHNITPIYLKDDKLTDRGSLLII